MVDTFSKVLASSYERIVILFLRRLLVGRIYMGYELITKIISSFGFMLQNCLTLGDEFLYEL